MKLTKIRVIIKSLKKRESKLFLQWFGYPCLRSLLLNLKPSEGSTNDEALNLLHFFFTLGFRLQWALTINSKQKLLEALFNT